MTLDLKWKFGVRLAALIICGGALVACDQTAQDEQETVAPNAAPAPAEEQQEDQQDGQSMEQSMAPVQEEAGPESALETAGPVSDASPLLASILAGDQRSDANKARDASRHPAETLAFFGLEPDMTVVEIWPFSGWYTEIIAPYLAQGSGTYYAARVRAPSPDDTFTQKFGDSTLYGNIVQTFHGLEGEGIAPDGSVDMVLSFRNLHNWMGAGWEDKAFADVYKALKPGGVFGIVDHRAKTDTEQDPKAASGYVREDYTIALAEKAGFVLVAASPINDNPKDTADHPFGVWTLPPTLANAPRGQPKDESFDSTLYIDIGESDRFTLKFMKPLEAPANE